MTPEFQRTRMLLGDSAMQTLAGARVAVFGVGGVGGYVVEALARSGVGALDLIDNDTVDITNINRQIIALHSTVGMPKTEAARRRVADIAPQCKVTTHAVFFLPETADRFDFSLYDYVVDAIDTVSGKLCLVQCVKAAGVPVISALGAGNKLDPTAFRVADIYETSVCPLARVMRTECRKRGIGSLKVVYSTEKPRRPAGQPQPEDGAFAGRRDIPGSVAFVPPAVGLIIAGEVVKDLTGVREIPS